MSVCSHNIVSKRWTQDKPGLAKILTILDSWSTKQMKDIDWDDPEFTKWRGVKYQTIIEEGGPSNHTFLQCEQGINYCNHPEVLGEKYFDREASISGNCFRVNPGGRYEFFLSPSLRVYATPPVCEYMLLPQFARKRGRLRADAAPLLCGPTRLQRAG